MADERAIRVFVSSTFRDMQAEREELVKRVFPQVRRLCEERGVAWSEVDLRWGVTDEQKAEGAVLPICLAEIDRSRPFFLGLLGQRYGWIPEEIPENLTSQLPWLGSITGTSVTEMEVLHGVLNDPDAAGHAFFHLRDPAWVETRTPEEQADLVDDPSDPNAPEVRRKLDELKERVKTSSHPWAQYADPEDLGRQVLTELTALVDRLFPADDVPDAVERADQAHRAYGQARLAGHLDRPAISALLDAHAAGTAPPLVLHGAPGSDLTPLVAAWLEGRTGVVVQHHAAVESDWQEMAARIIVGLGGPAETPAGATARRAALFSALERSGPAIVVVDGAELLDDLDGAPDLTWLPPEVPANVRVVVTTSGSRPVDEALRRGWPVHEVPPLTEAERREFATTFLARWSKGLDPQHLDRLATAPQTGNVLFLRTLLDELRQHGDHFTIGEVIERHLAAETVDDVLEVVLARYEGDFERERPGLVGDAMRAIWAARTGITEPELLELLGGSEPLPSAIWSPLVLAAEAGLVTRSGLLAFATPAHRQAVEDRYLATDEHRRGAHASLAAYFRAQPLGPRVVDELPWQQLAAGDLDGLVATISDLAYLDLAYPLAPRDLRTLWARAEESGRSVVEGYRPVIDHPEQHAEEAWAVARLVTDAGHPTEALVINRFLVEHYRGTADGDLSSRPNKRLRGSLLNLAAALFFQGDLAGAEPVLGEAIERSRAAGDDVVLQASLGNLGLIRRDRGDAAGAVPLLEESLAICRRLGDAGELQAALGNLAGALRALARYPEALACFDEQEALCRSVGDQHGLGLALAGRAAVLADTGDPAGAVAAIQAWRTSATEAGDLKGQLEATITEADTLRQLGRRDEAATLREVAEQLARRTSDEPLLARVLDAHARAAVEEGRWAEAERFATEAVLTARSCQADSVLVLALGSLGIAQREQGNIAGSAQTHAEEEAVAARMGNPGAVAAAKVNQGAVAIVQNDLQTALRLYGEAEPTLKQLGLAMVLVPMLNNRWQIHSMMGNHPAAIADLIDCGAQCATVGADPQRVEVLTKAVELLYQSGRMAEAEPVWQSLAEGCRNTGDDAGLQRAIGERALLVMGRGDLATAGPLFDEQEAICRRTNDQVGLAACVGNKAILKQQQGDIPAALALVDEQLALATATGNGQGVLFATANRGELLGQLGRIDEGLAALGQARQMAAQWNLTPMVQQLDQMIQQLQAKRN